MHCLSVYTLLHIQTNILLFFFNNLNGSLRKVVIAFHLFSVFQIIKELLMFTLRGKNKLPFDQFFIQHLPILFTMIFYRKISTESIEETMTETMTKTGSVQSAQQQFCLIPVLNKN